MFFRESISKENEKKIKVKMNNPKYLGLSIPEISKWLIDEFWYDYIKLDYQYNVKLCHMEIHTFKLKSKHILWLLNKLTIVH